MSATPLQSQTGNCARFAARPLTEAGTPTQVWLEALAGDILHGRPGGTWCAANWRGDGHPDHEAVGRAAAIASARSGVTLLEYPVWMWHWASTGDTAVPWDRLCALPVSDDALERKTVAAQCYRSQFEGPGGQGAAVLPPFVVDRLLQVGEVVIR